MYSTRFSFLFALAIFLSSAVADPNSVCNTFGIDFVDGNSYFINTLSNDSFTCVSEFEGCNADVADIMLVLPNTDELICSEVPTTPDDTPEMSTCPIQKDQMVSGLYRILIMGNNGDGNPFAYERDIELDCGPQVTSTVTPTVTYNITVTPTSTSKSWSTVYNTTTFGPTTTYTIPSKTAHRTKTVTPTPVTSYITHVYTKHLMTWTKTQTIITSTVTASCSVPPKPQWPDKRCTYSPTLIHPKALQTPAPKNHRIVRRADRAVDIDYARRRIQDAKLRRDTKLKALNERAPDAPTVYVTASTAVNTTVTYTAATTTTTEIDLTTSIVSTTLPPSTVYSGIYTSTITLPTPTKTKYTIAYTTIWTTKTIHATWTRTTITTPSASVTQCKKQGGHFPGRW
ncbi:hypothetical protein AOQ84DRAFT_328859 [Glonium stellatum]|uniref:Uncharacterized protein n=1 Tax=Glonium stellatum TaxID=574774 RepID=A0A8E2EMT9_9PEZI|nr:hypothetical protein AOQ84DRAFT_328859 [Glonium stellatum]